MRRDAAPCRFPTSVSPGGHAAMPHPWRFTIRLPRCTSLTTHYFRVRGNISATFYNGYKPPVVPLPGKLGFEPHRPKIILPPSFLFSSTVFYFYAPPISLRPLPATFFLRFSLYLPGLLCQYIYI